LLVDLVAGGLRDGPPDSNTSGDKDKPEGDLDHSPMLKAIVDAGGDGGFEGGDGFGLVEGWCGSFWV
jgi:hypothetical protein